MTASVGSRFLFFLGDNMDFTFVEGKTLPDLWFKLLYQLLSAKKGVHQYVIDQGSYVGESRYEFDFIVMRAEYPGARPLIPDVPPGIGIPSPVESIDYIEQYFVNYLMNAEVHDNETYTYGTWIAPALPRVIEQLKGGYGTNQATISIGGWALMKKTENQAFIDTDDLIDKATEQRDPACLRTIDFRLDQENKLHMVTLWRSWDLFGGLPCNLAGLQLVKEYVAHEIDAEDGQIIAVSKGLHLYSFVMELAEARTGLQAFFKKQTPKKQVKKQVKKS